MGAGYFATLNEPMLAGREFAEPDQRSQQTASKTLPAVLNESAARGFFGNGNAIGKRVRDDKQSYEVVGVVHDLKDVHGFSQSIIYLPLTPRDFARPPAGGMTILVRSDAGADALSAIRNEIALHRSQSQHLQHTNARRLPGPQPVRVAVLCSNLRRQLECLAWCWPPLGSPGSRPTRLRKGARRSPSARR